MNRAKIEKRISDLTGKIMDSAGRGEPGERRAKWGLERARLVHDLNKGAR